MEGYESKEDAGKKLYGVTHKTPDIIPVVRTCYPHDSGGLNSRDSSNTRKIPRLDVKPTKATKEDSRSMFRSWKKFWVCADKLQTYSGTKLGPTMQRRKRWLNLPRVSLLFVPVQSLTRICTEKNSVPRRVGVQDASTWSQRQRYTSFHEEDRA